MKTIAQTGQGGKLRHVPRPFTRFIQIANAYGMVLFFGPVVLPLIWWLRWTGRIVLIQENRALEALREGRTIIAANHPSLIEPFVLSTVFISHCILRPDQYWPWAMPDRRTFLPSWLWRLYWFFRCITVDRGTRGGHSATALRKAHFVLESGCSLVIHPEGGRTGKGSSHIQKCNRKLRRIPRTPIIRLAQKTEAKILPVWIDFKGAELVCVPGARGALLQIFHDTVRLCSDGMVIYFGEPYNIPLIKDHDEAVFELEQRILSA